MPNRGCVAWNVLIIGLLAAAIVVPGAPVVAQDRFNCDDFASQAEAQATLDRTFPDDPNGLDSDEDGIACESEFGLTAADEAEVATTREAGGSLAADDARDSGTGRDTNSAAATASPAASGSDDMPSDVLARVEGCAVVAISSHDVAAAGCPGGQSIVFRTPADAPGMGSTVIFNPGAPEASNAETGAALTAATGARAAAHDRASSARSRRGKQPDDRGESGTGKKSKDGKKARADKKDKSRKDRRKR